MQRWRELTPLGLPFPPLADYEYIEYCIPKGTSVLIKKKAMNLDAKIFTNPNSFHLVYICPCNLSFEVLGLLSPVTPP
jgi:cytochrome P450